MERDGVEGPSAMVPKQEAHAFQRFHGARNYAFRYVAGVLTQVHFRGRTCEAKLIDATSEKIVDLPRVRHPSDREQGQRAEVRRGGCSQIQGMHRPRDALVTPARGHSFYGELSSGFSSHRHDEKVPAVQPALHLNFRYWTEV